MEKTIRYSEMEAQTGFTIDYLPANGSVEVRAEAQDGSIAATFTRERVDEAHILYMEATELLRSRAEAKDSHEDVRKRVKLLFGLFNGVRPPRAVPLPRPASDEFRANPGKKLEIDVDGVSYLRLPVRTRLITLDDTDLMPLIDEYVAPYCIPGDIIFVSEKALTITQGRVMDMSEIQPSKLAHFLSRRVGNYYGSAEFRGFGHGTALAMQAFIDEAGYPRVLFAAAVSAITRPLGIRGAFYYLCGKRAKSVDCPMSFLILDYAHSVKLAPNDPNGVSRKIREHTDCEAVILDANYRGAFSLGKSSRSISEAFIGKLFRDNPAGQSDEMTPFVIVRKK